MDMLPPASMIDARYSIIASMRDSNAAENFCPFALPANNASTSRSSSNCWYDTACSQMPPPARVWLPEAKAILERGVLLQHTPDRVNCEQAVAYQQCELDLAVLRLV